VDGLLTTKWVLEGSGEVVAEFAEGATKKYLHQSLPLVFEDVASVNYRAPSENAEIESEGRGSDTETSLTSKYIRSTSS